jgi:hypothetical protein
MQNPLTFEAFAKWLDSKPKDETYVFTAGRGCAIAQYVKEVGVKSFDAAGCTGWFDTDMRPHVLIPRGSIVADHPWTFGAAADRAKAFL